MSSGGLTKIFLSRKAGSDPGCAKTVPVRRRLRRRRCLALFPRSGLEERAVEPVDVVDETVDGITRQDALAALLAHALAQVGVTGQAGEAVGQLVGCACLDEE